MIEWVAGWLGGHLMRYYATLRLCAPLGTETMCIYRQSVGRAPPNVHTYLPTRATHKQKQKESINLQ